MLRRLLENLNKLLRELRGAEGELKALMSSGAYNMMIDFQRDEFKPRVSEHFQKILDAKILMLKRQIRAMDNSKYPEAEERPQVIYRTTHSIGTSTTVNNATVWFNI